jgi:uncharacterized protein (TIGR03435 family)
MKQPNSFLSCSLALFVFSPVVQAQSGLKLGSPAPPLALRKVLQAPLHTRGTWDELKGKAVVIEFWATWCGGCVDNIPHLNELAKEFESRPIQFISVTDESDDDYVKQFLVKHPVQGWVAFDDQVATFKNYGVEGRPRTMLVDRNGVLQADTNPPSVTAQVLEDLISGKHLNFPEVQMSLPLGFEPGAPAPLMQALIRPAAPSDVSHMSPGGVMEFEGRYEMYGQTLRGLLAEAYQIPENRIDAPEWCNKLAYDISIVTPQHREDLRSELLRHTLESTFRIKLHREMQEARVYVLRKVAGQEPKLRAAASEGKSGYWNFRKGEIEARAASVGKVVRLAQFVLGNESMDETGLKGQYDFALKWDASLPNTLVAAIREQLGLELALESRKLEHLVVDSIEDSKTW